MRKGKYHKNKNSWLVDTVVKKLESPLLIMSLCVCVCVCVCVCKNMTKIINLRMRQIQAHMLLDSSRKPEFIVQRDSSQKSPWLDWNQDPSSCEVTVSQSHWAQWTGSVELKEKCRLSVYGSPRATTFTAWVTVCRLVEHLRHWNFKLMQTRSRYRTSEVTAHSSVNVYTLSSDLNQSLHLLPCNYIWRESRHRITGCWEAVREKVKGK